MFIRANINSKIILKLIDEYNKDYFTNSRKVYLINTYKELKVNILKNKIFDNRNELNFENFIEIYNNLDNIVKSCNEE